MSRLSIKIPRVGVAIEIGPDVRVTVTRNGHGGKCLLIEAPPEFRINRIDPAAVANPSDRKCPRCLAALKRRSDRCGACGKVLEELP